MLIAVCAFHALLHALSLSNIYISVTSCLSPQVVSGEDRGVWRLFLDRANKGNATDFQAALAHCKTDAARDRVLRAQAEYYFTGGQHELAAKYYARTRTSFEEAALRLRGHPHALKTFLLLKLDAFARGNKTQRAIVGTWIVELFLEQLDRAEGNTEQRVLGEDTDGSEGRAFAYAGGEFGNGTLNGTGGRYEGGRDSPPNADVGQLRREFRSFLEANQPDLGRPPTSTVVFNLLASHGRVDELLFFARVVGDLERVIANYIQRGEHASAVSVLRSQADAPQGGTVVGTDELYYKFSPALVEYEPAAMVDAWVGARFLSPRKLMPAIVQHTQRRNMRRRRRRAREAAAGVDKAFVFLDDGERSDTRSPPPSETRNGAGGESQGDDIAVRYLNHCVSVNWNRDPAVHNYLLSLYAKGGDASALLQFLQSQSGGPGGRGGRGDVDDNGAAAAAVVDLKYALRVCSRAGMDRACVQIYSAMGLYDEAVHRALAKGDVALAKKNADHPQDGATRKRLWKRIARHVIRAPADQAQAHEAAIAVLDESRVLAIEDVLSFCPVFGAVGAFKAQVCDALHEYTERAKELEDEMEDYVESAQAIRDDINRVLERPVPAALRAPCGLCGQRVATADHYVFPCTHRFHCACLVREVRERSRTVDPGIHARVQELEAQIYRLSAQIAAPPVRRTATGSTMSEELQARQRRAAAMQRDLLVDELDEMVASQCPFCSDVMIQAVGTGFILPEEEEQEGKLWRL